MPWWQFHDIGMNTSSASCYRNLSPGFSLIIGNLHNRHIASIARIIVKTQPVSKNPPAIRQDLYFLPAEGTLSGKQYFFFSPWVPAILWYFTSNFSSVLKIEVTFHFRSFCVLCRINQPDFPRRRKEQRWILLWFHNIIRHLNRICPFVFSRTQSWHYDTYICISFPASGKPAAKQIPIIQFQ